MKSLEQLLFIAIEAELSISIVPTQIDTTIEVRRMHLMPNRIDYEKTIINNIMYRQNYDFALRSILEQLISRILTPPERDKVNIPEHPHQGKLEFIDNTNLQSSE